MSDDRLIGDALECGQLKRAAARLTVTRATTPRRCMVGRLAWWRLWFTVAFHTGALPPD